MGWGRATEKTALLIRLYINPQNLKNDNSIFINFLLSNVNVMLQIRILTFKATHVLLRHGSGTGPL
jgi:hypothetical protein